VYVLDYVEEDVVRVPTFCLRQKYIILISSSPPYKRKLSLSSRRIKPVYLFENITLINKVIHAFSVRGHGKFSEQVRGCPWDPIDKTKTEQR
jgi:hypothetical protein